MEKNYKIKIEALDGAESVIPEEWEKSTCEGFALLTYDGKRWNWIVQNASVKDLAEGLVRCDAMMEAGMIAQGMMAAAEYHERRAAEGLKKLFSIPLGRNGEMKSR